MKATHSLYVMAATVALLAFSAPLPAFAQMKDMSSKDHRQGHGQMMQSCDMDRMDDMVGMCSQHAEKMGLTDDQMAKINPLHSDMQKKQARFKADLKIAEIELMDIMEAKDFDLEKATFAAKKIGEIKTTHHVEMLKAMKEMRTILTDEQFKNMKKMMSMKTDEKKHTKRMMKKK
ncbi:MAG: Spy/CpxP family protein refolding chaperone [Desulfuromonadales bacterium]|nr:Spy/CpxP family protein refolding chaperone [Desulfuromonadales bacterium]